MARVKRKIPVSASRSLDELARDWHGLDNFQRGDRLIPLRPHYTILELATRLTVSKKLIRDFLLFSDIPLNYRHALAGIGRKKILQERRQYKAAQRRWKKLLSGSSGRALRNRLVLVLRNWFIANLRPEIWDRFCDIMLTEWWISKEPYRQYRCRNWREIALDGDWKAIIDNYKPPEPVVKDPWIQTFRNPWGYPRPEPSLDDMITFWVQWLAAWYTRCMPDDEVAKSVFIRARRELRKYARKRYRLAPSWEIS